LEPEFPLSYLATLSAITVNAPDFKIVIGLLILIILLFGSALMSGSEVAFFSFRPEDIEKFKSNKNKQAKIALKLYNNPEKLLSTILVANNTINIAIVLLSAFISTRLFDFSSEPVIGFIVNVIVITFLLLFFGEVMPKVYASRNHVAVAMFMAFPLTVLEKIFQPVTAMLIFSSSFVKKRSGTRRSNISMDDLSDALELTSDDFKRHCKFREYKRKCNYVSED
jgi:putative hemolysin